MFLKACRYLFNRCKAAWGSSIEKERNTVITMKGIVYYNIARCSDLIREIKMQCDKEHTIEKSLIAPMVSAWDARLDERKKELGTNAKKVLAELGPRPRTKSAPHIATRHKSWRKYCGLKREVSKWLCVLKLIRFGEATNMPLVIDSCDTLEQKRMNLFIGKGGCLMTKADKDGNCIPCHFHRAEAQYVVREVCTMFFNLYLTVKSGNMKIEVMSEIPGSDKMKEFITMVPKDFSKIEKWIREYAARHPKGSTRNILKELGLEPAQTSTSALTLVNPLASLNTVAPREGLVEACATVAGPVTNRTSEGTPLA